MWKSYMIAIGGLIFAFLVLCILLIEHTLQILTNFWLSFWTNHLTQHSTTYYLTIYGVLNAVAAIMMFGESLTFNWAGLNSSKSLHKSMLKRGEDYQLLFTLIVRNIFSCHHLGVRPICRHCCSI